MQNKMLVEDFVYGIPAHESAELLLHQLLQHNGTMEINMSDRMPSIKEIVFEMEMDGFHYTLTRTWAETPIAKYRLSPREQQIVRLVAEGLPNKTIAGKLHISPCTVATHIRRVFDKLNAKSRAEMVARALEYKL